MPNSHRTKYVGIDKTIVIKVTKIFSGHFKRGKTFPNYSSSYYKFKEGPAAAINLI
jgi:hypothetical protein